MFSRTIVILIFVIASICSEARPVSYPTGTTVMFMNDGDVNSVHMHYSPTARYSVGYRGFYSRLGSYHFNGLQFNYLAKRKNMPAAQANFYVKSGLGVATQDSQNSLAAFVGVAMDWENRRYFTSYENRYVQADVMSSSFSQEARVGFAPYIGDYGDLHTWLMIQLDHNPNTQDEFRVTPLVRFFKGEYLTEIGMSDSGEVLFNFVARF